MTTATIQQLTTRLPQKTKTFKVTHSNRLISVIKISESGKKIPKSLAPTLIAIAAHWSPKRNPWPSQERLAEMTCTTTRNIKRHVKRLRELDFIQTNNNRRSLTYSFNMVKLGSLFYGAVEYLRKEALAKHIKEAKKEARKCHLKIVKNCPPNKDTYVSKDLDNTVSQNSLVSLESVQSKKPSIAEIINNALTSEIKHLSALKQKAAYNAAVKQNQINRGERFTDEEKQRRQRISEQNRPEREAAAKTANRIVELEKAIINYGAAVKANLQPKKDFTYAMFSELVKLTRGINNLSFSAKHYADKLFNNAEIAA